jgi:hypothetical protein
VSLEATRHDLAGEAPQPGQRGVDLRPGHGPLQLGGGFPAPVGHQLAVHPGQVQPAQRALGVVLHRATLVGAGEPAHRLGQQALQQVVVVLVQGAGEQRRGVGVAGQEAAGRGAGGRGTGGIGTGLDRPGEDRVEGAPERGVVRRILDQRGPQRGADLSPGGHVDPGQRPHRVEHLARRHRQARRAQPPGQRLRRRDGQRHGRRLRLGIRWAVRVANSCTHRAPS